MNRVRKLRWIESIVKACHSQRRRQVGCGRKGNQATTTEGLGANVTDAYPGSECVQSLPR
jgi:hypothetical protein